MWNLLCQLFCGSNSLTLAHSQLDKKMVYLITAKKQRDIEFIGKGHFCSAGLFIIHEDIEASRIQIASLQFTSVTPLMMRIT